MSINDNEHMLRVHQRGEDPKEFKRMSEGEMHYEKKRQIFSLFACRKERDLKG